MEIVPFGKYKGQPVEVLANDRGYCDWLMSQGEFMDRFPQVKTLIVNNFKEPEDTPDHNRLQGLFLDKEFCVNFSEEVLKVEYYGRHNEYKEIFPIIKDHACKGVIKRIGLHNHGEIEMTSLNNMLSDFEHRDIEEFPETYIESISFEKGGVDVSFDYISKYESIYFEYDYKVYHAHYDYERDSYGPHDVDSEFRNIHNHFKVEIKPSVGDDFPSIMRQMKSNKCNTLFYTEYTGQGLTEEQMRKMMKIENIDTIRLDEIK